MAGFSTYLSRAIINATLVTPTVPTSATLYLALFSSPGPTDDNTGTTNEIATGTWYARRPTGAWTLPAGTAIAASNTSVITYSAVTGSPVTVSHWGIYDAATSGNLLYTDSIGSAKTFAVGDQPVIAAGALTITID